MFEFRQDYKFHDAVLLGDVVPFRCWNCEVVTAPSFGMKLGDQYGGNYQGFVGICPICKAPTFKFMMNREWHQRPIAPYASEIKGLPRDIDTLFREALACLAGDAPTAAVMICRKLLMTVAVHFDAPSGREMDFKKYVEYLASESLISSAMKGFTEKVREVGNEANHQIHPQTMKTAELMVRFIANILRNNFEAASLLDPDELTLLDD